MNHDSGQYSHTQLLEALEVYNQARDRSSQSGDWSIWASVFTEDALYIEHVYGEFHGRQEIEEWICKVMAPFPNMTFPQDWVATDEEKGAVVFQCQNVLPPPLQDNGRAFSFPSWTRLVYAGDGLWSLEEDVYNPSRDANPTVKAWLEGGGKFLSPELVKMRHP